MLASSANQYLRPEYLTPLPTTLDAKKSPLALLAQTCSQIGADASSTNGKSLLTSLEKSANNKSNKSSESSRDKSSPATIPGQGTGESNRMSFKPYESCLGQEKSSTPDEQRSSSSHSTGGRSRTPGSNGKRCPSNQSVSSNRAVTPQGRKTATPNGEMTTRESPSTRIPSSSYAESITTSSSQHRTVSSSPSSHSKSSYSPAGVLAMTDPFIKDMPLGTFKTSLPSSTATPSSSTYSLGYTHQLPIDVMTSSIMSQHHAAAAAAALKNGLSANPYLGYGRLKGSGAGDSIMPVCRDPYCTGCQLNSHLFGPAAGAATANGKLSNTTSTASCPAGCVQCDHKPNSASPYGPLGAAYAHAQLAALAAVSQLPYVCNWIAGDTAYCGKRFATSEELLQHLRSHTNISTTGSGASAGTDPTSAAAVAALSLLSPPVGLPPTHPLFSRTYPTPPLSPLATARYHPYGKPTHMLPPSLSSLGLPIPPPHPHSAGLPPYFSPYSLYGAARLGATSGMHP